MSNNNNTNDYNEREGRVLELYDHGKSTREIAKELRMSLRDIGFILKKGQVNHGIVTIMDDGNNNSSNNNNNDDNGDDLLTGFFHLNVLQKIHQKVVLHLILPLDQRSEF